MKRLVLILSFLNLGSIVCFAQQMDTFILKDFEVKSISNAPRNIGITKFNLNTIRYNTLTDALQNQSALFIKQYGTGGLATSGMRGMGAQHTAILWNGIAINSCMNSNIDLNLIPFFLVDNASVETGANSAACGNGTIAGAIQLSNNVEKQNRVFLNLQTGSFGYYQLGAGAVYRIKKVRLKTRILMRTANNNIEYHDVFIPEEPLQRQTNSAYVQKGFLQELDVQFLKFNTFKLSLWYLENKRELPTAMGVSNLANEKQYDMNSRMVAHHIYKKTDKLVINNKLAVLYDQLNYYNAFYPTAYSFSKTIVAESEWLYKFNRSNRITNSVNNTYSTAKTDGYSNWPDRNMLSYWFKYEWQDRNDKIILSLGNRFLLVDQKVAPMSPDFAFQMNVNKMLKIKGNVAFSYRVPSFNDYYWLPGGNKDLLPERGFKQELTSEVKKGNAKLTVTGFHHIVNDWVVWVQDGNIWSAKNAKQVRSGGIEISLEAVKKIGNHLLQLTGRYQFVKSINTKTYTADEAILNKQLIYTPNHSAAATLNYSYKKFFATITEQFTSSRYTTSDNSPSYQLNSYFLTNAIVGVMLDYKKHQAICSFTINNMLNSSYQNMMNIPTPLRNYQLTIKYNINNEQN